MSRAAARLHLAPLVIGWIEYDNRQGKSPVKLVFGVGNGDDTQRPFDDNGAELAGFASGGRFGFATAPARGIELRQGFDILHRKFLDYRGLHVIAGESALVFTVPAGRRRRCPLVLGFYAAGPVSSGIDTRYAYTRVFRDLEDVLVHGLKEFKHYDRVAARRDRELERSRLTADQQFLLAQATHSYLGSTQLLWHKGKPLWVVNEGEYRMINTFDLTVDHLFFELDWQPWAVRNAVDFFAERYAYTDQLGISFVHDMGVNDYFTPPGRSSYECDGIEGCFSHMTMEQLLNWVLCATTYAAHTGDTAWLRGKRRTLLACADSMRNRDHPDPARRDGILKQDTARVGRGAEITTYDSLDVSLGQARNNLYLSVKALGTWVLLERAFATLGLKAATAAAAASADLLARTPHDQVRAGHRILPCRLRERQPLAHPAGGRRIRVPAVPRLQRCHRSRWTLRPAAGPAAQARRPGLAARRVPRCGQRWLEDEQHQHQHMVLQDRDRTARHPSTVSCSPESNRA